MPKINYATEVTDEMREAKKDYLDRHTPHVVAPGKVARGEPFSVVVKMGQDYVHPDTDDHHIQRLQLFNRDSLLATAIYEPGATTAGMDEQKGFTSTVFNISLAGSARLSALTYCTKHGLWMSEECAVEVV
jgi:superoxide reductase